MCVFMFVHHGNVDCHPQYGNTFLGARYHQEEDAQPGSATPTTLYKVQVSALYYSYLHKLIH